MLTYKKTIANAIGEVHDSSDATAVTPTRTRRNGDAAKKTSGSWRKRQPAMPQVPSLYPEVHLN